MIRTLTALALGLLLLAPAAAKAAPALSEPVPARDGTALATDVWLPDGTGPWPVLLRRTPYGRALDESTGSGFAGLGYSVVSQDVRGRGDSEGRFLPFFDDATDGPDTMAWIVAQPWSNGRIGSWGGSAEGIVQLLALPDAPDSLRCAFPMVATDDVYRDLFPGGAWRQDLATNWLNGLGAADALAAWRAHEAGDGYWDPARLDAAERSRIRAAVLLAGGFYDIFAAGTLRTWQALGGESGRDAFLIVGPWTHGGVNVPENGPLQEGEVAYPAAAAYRDFYWDFLDLFDWCLRDGPRPAWAPLRYATTTLSDDGRSARAQWRTADRWEPDGALSSPVFLHPGGTLRADLPAREAAPVALPVDPATPLPSVGGANLSTPAGPRDQAAVDGLAGVAVFRTAPLDRDVLLQGEPRARLVASSSTDDGDVVVRLSQVTPSGRVMLLTDGVLRGRFLKGTAAPVPLVPGLAATWEIPLGPLSHVIPAGHALEIAVQGTSAPRYEPNPGTSAPLASNPGPTPSTLTLYLDPDRGPCSVTLPVGSGRPPWEDGMLPDASPEGADLPVAPDVPAAAEEEAADEAAEDRAAADDGTAADDGAAADTTLDAPPDAPPLPGRTSGGCTAGGGTGGDGPAGTAAFAWTLAAAMIAAFGRRRVSRPGPGPTRPSGPRS